MSHFSLLSLNIFGIPFYLGWNRLLRLARVLDRQPATLLCLQEVQQNAYVPLLRRALGSYSHHAGQRHNYAPQGGLAVFSRHPLESSAFHPYAARGHWLSLGVADWALYKGILAAHLRVDGLPITVLNTHMHANYMGDWNPSEKPRATTGVQQRQVEQLVELVLLQPPDTLVLVCGDLNFPRNCFLYESLLQRSGLLDPLSADGRPTYRPFPLVPSHWRISLDYALIRYPENRSPDKFHLQADIQEIQDPAHWLPTGRFLTDHNALTLIIEWE